MRENLAINMQKDKLFIFPRAVVYPLRRPRTEHADYSSLAFLKHFENI